MPSSFLVTANEPVDRLVADLAHEGSLRTSTICAILQRSIAPE
jgi:hypothetical protein